MHENELFVKLVAYSCTLPDETPEETIARRKALKKQKKLEKDFVYMVMGWDKFGRKIPDPPESDDIPNELPGDC